jgi:predicted amidohydrolase YtcJ
MKQFLYLCATLLLLSGCNQPNADLIVYNAKIYTVNDQFEIAEAMAIKDGKILSVGKTADIQKNYTAAENINANAKAIYPGFIDAHAHFLRYGESLQNVDLRGTTSWDDVIKRVTEFAKTHPDGWLTGRGWDQNDWADKQFPTKEKLDELFPNRPVLLERVDGHASIANQSALNAANITKSFKLVGGDIIEKNGKLTGVLIDNAVSLVASKVPAPSAKLKRKMLLDAQKNCFEVGLTTINDCGLDAHDVDFIEQMQKDKSLKMRLYIMLSDAKKNYDYLIKRGAIKTDRLNVRAFKVYADGALGSRGASLLHHYSDMPNNRGFLLSEIKHFEEVAELINKHNFQMCTHAIGDSANRSILKIYNKVLAGKNDKRWRIEHAQVVSKNDFNLFGSANIVPSVQPTHATSDMYWAADRLGNDRVKNAYAYKQLLDQNGWIPLGTDFPVEQINPMLTFFAATARKDANNYPKNGYQMENALTKKETLKGMTMWAAKSQFDEKQKGS